MSIEPLMWLRDHAASLYSTELRKAGFKPVGIVPAFDRDRMADGDVMRVPEIVYARVLCPGEKIYRPSFETMTPQVRALWEFLFGVQT